MGMSPGQIMPPNMQFGGMLVSWFDCFFIPFTPEINTVSCKPNWHLVTKDYLVSICFFVFLCPETLCSLCFIVNIGIFYATFRLYPLWSTLFLSVSYERFWLRVWLNFCLKFRIDIIAFCLSRCSSDLPSSTINSSSRYYHSSPVWKLCTKLTGKAVCLEFFAGCVIPT